MTAAPLRLGVFGGAFDPPHVAHVALARAALEQLALDELRVFPTGQAWHKAHQLTPAQHRLAMARIAFGELDHTFVDEREMLRAGPTYTIDTLRELQSAQPAAELYLVMGEDQAAALTRWHEWQAVLQLATLCVAARPHARQAGGPAHPTLPPQARVRELQLPGMPESATEIRERMAAGQGIALLVPPGVARYIDQHHLYRTA